MKASAEKVQEDMDYASSIISSQVRLASVALLGVVWGLLIGEPSALAGAILRYRALLLSLAFLGVLALLVDFLQYVAGYITSKRLHDRMTAAGEEYGEYVYSSRGCKIRRFMFWSKQVVVAGGLLLFLVMISLFLGSRGPEPPRTAPATQGAAASQPDGGNGVGLHGQR